MARDLAESRGNYPAQLILIQLKIKQDIHPGYALPGINHQSFYRLIVHQMGLDNLIDIIPVNIGIPDALRIDDHHRATQTAPQAAGLTNTYLTFAIQIALFDFLLHIIAHRLRVEIIAGRVFLPAVGTNKNVIFIEFIRHNQRDDE